MEQKSNCVLGASEDSQKASKEVESKMVAIAPDDTTSPLDPDTSNIGAFTSVDKKQRSVALETGTFTAMNAQALELPLQDREITALVDSGAQRSLITKAAVDGLGLKIKASESATLQGFDDKSPKSKFYKVVQIVMGKIGKRPIIMDASVINSLNDIHM